MLTKVPTIMWIVQRSKKTERDLCMAIVTQC